MALYLKQCSVLLQLYYGGEPPEASHSVWVATGRQGLPKIIPVHHRRLISVRDDRSDMLVKLYLSALSLYKIVKLAKPLSYANIASIEDLSVNSAGTMNMCVEWLKECHHRIIPRYLSQVHRIPIYMGLRWVPTWKSVPNQCK